MDEAFLMARAPQRANAELEHLGGLAGWRGSLFFLLGSRGPGAQPNLPPTPTSSSIPNYVDDEYELYSNVSVFRFQGRFISGFHFQVRGLVMCQTGQDKVGERKKEKKLATRRRKGRLGGDTTKLTAWLTRPAKPQSGGTS